MVWHGMVMTDNVCYVSIILLSDDADADVDVHGKREGSSREIILRCYFYKPHRYNSSFTLLIIEPRNIHSAYTLALTSPDHTHTSFPISRLHQLIQLIRSHSSSS